MSHDLNRSGGAFLVDKPPGMTSADVVSKIKRKFKLSRIGHAGTLDPFATGLLIVLFGKATKLQDIFMTGRKTYQGMIRVGTKTSTDDITGEVLETDPQIFGRWDEISNSLHGARARFLGQIKQIPPAVSAIKVNGERSYKLARKGKQVELTARDVTIFELELEAKEAPSLSYSVSCSKGTYIRSLARDIGEALETVACVDTLCRVESLPYHLAEAKPLEQLLQSDELAQYAVPFSKLTSSLPSCIIDDEIAGSLRLGKQDYLCKLESRDEEYLLLKDQLGDPVALLERSKEPAKSWKIRFVI